MSASSRRYPVLQLLAATLATASLLLFSGGSPAADSSAAATLTRAWAGADANARVIVKFRSDSSAVRALSASGSGGSGPVLRLAQRLSQRHGLLLTDGRQIGPRTQVLHGMGLASAALAQRLAQDPEVEYAEVDRPVHALATPNDPLFADNQAGTTPVAGQWYLRAPNATLVSAINASAAWDVTTGDPNVVVAVIDTGVRSDHPDLAGKLIAGYDFVSSAAKANDGDARDSDPSDPGDWVTSGEAAGTTVGTGCTAEDSSWHGTQTAGLVGAATNNGSGMAGTGYNVKVLPLRVLGKCGGYISDVVDAMRWAAGISVSGVPGNPLANRAKVINLSLGSSGSCGLTFQSAINDVTALGVTVVVAAGNGNGFAVDAPANCSGAIAVAGVRHSGSKVGYSNLGPEVTVAAPAGNCVTTTGVCQYPVLSTTNTGTQGPVTNTYSTGLGSVSVGTSFSSPLVAGTVGLMLSANPGLTPAQSRVILQRTSRAFPATGGSPGTLQCQAPSSSEQLECYCTTSTCGAGLLDAGAALAAIQQSRVFASLTPSTTSPSAGQSMTVSASAVAAGAGRSMTGYQWQIINGTGSATLSSGDGTGTATIAVASSGTFTVQLNATDDQGHSDVQSVVLTAGATASPAASGGGGGGALDPFEIALIFAAVAMSARWARRRS